MIFSLTNCACKENVKVSISGNLSNKLDSIPISDFMFTIVHFQTYNNGYGGCTTIDNHIELQTDSLGNFKAAFENTQEEDFKTFTFLNHNYDTLFVSRISGDLGIIYIESENL